MRMALIHESPYKEGRWRRFDLIYKHLKTLGNDVKIFAFSGKETNREDVIDVYVLLPFRMLGTALYFVASGLITNPSYLIKTCWMIKKFKPDVILFHHYDIGALLLLVKPFFFKNAKLVYDLNDLRVRMTYYDKENGMLFKLFSWIEEIFVSKHADRIVVTTNFAKKYLAQKGISSDKIFVLNELVYMESFNDEKARESRLKSFKDPAQKKVLVWHGFIRHYQANAVALIIKAISVVQKEIPIKLLVIGPFEDKKFEEKLKSQANELKVDVEFAGWVPHVQIPKMLNSAQIGVHALPNDLFARFINGVKLSEYICSGLPVLCSNLEGPSELVRGNGLLFNPEDYADLAEKIREMIAGDYSGLMKNSLRIAEEEFSDKAVAKRILSFEKFLEVGNGG